MLEVTPEATEILKETRSRSGAPAEAGVRIHQAAGNAQSTKTVRLSFETEPEPTDQTIETPALRIFVAKELVEPLSERVLDVKPSHDGMTLTFV
jgi:Fe-S cluster assembly iron-binding protein IscA